MCWLTSQSIAGIEFWVTAIHDDAGQAKAVKEGFVDNGGDSAGQGHAQRVEAVAERVLADGGDRVGRALVSYRRGNDHITSISRCSIRDNGFVAIDVVVDTVHLKVVGQGGGWQQ